MTLGSSVKGLTAPRPVKQNKSKKEQVAEKTINSLSNVSKLLDHNTFEHVKTKMDNSIDDVGDKYLLHKTFLGRKEEDVDAHEERLKQISSNESQPTEVSNSDDDSIVHMDDLKKGNIEVQLPRKN